MSTDKKTIHVLSCGLPLCEFVLDVPSKWPPGHAWVGESGILKATCHACQVILGARHGVQTGMGVTMPKILAKSAERSHEALESFGCPACRWFASASMQDVTVTRHERDQLRLSLQRIVDIDESVGLTMSGADMVAMMKSMRDALNSAKLTLKNLTHE